MAKAGAIIGSGVGQVEARPQGWKLGRRGAFVSSAGKMRRKGRRNRQPAK
jgi:hypothetical protein